MTNFYKQLLIVLISCFLVFFCIDLCAQSSKMMDEDYSLKKAQKIHLLTDKVVYTPNEQLWFSAFIFTDNHLVKDTADVMVVGLQDPVTNHILFSKKFLMMDFISTGNLLLPDSLLSGDYNLFAYTNLSTSGKPLTLTVNKISIYNNSGTKSFVTQLSIVDSLSNDQEMVIKYDLIPAVFRMTFDGAKAFYSLDNGANKKLKLDINGKGLITLNNKNWLQHEVLTVTTVYNGDTAKSKINIKHKADNDLHINFYPEGGFLMANMANEVYWEAVQNNVASSLNAALYEDDELIDSIYTEPGNNHNFFTIIPKIGKKYTAKLKTDKGEISYSLPEIQNCNINLHFPKLVVDDTLVVQIRSKVQQPVRIVLIDVDGNASYKELTIEGNKKVSIVLDELNTGLAKIVVLDKENKIIAKNYFYAHFQNKNKVTIIADKESYKVRDSVQFAIGIVDKDNKPLNGIATINNVLMSRVDYALLSDIETGVLLGELTSQEAGYVRDNRLLDDQLLLEKVIRLHRIDDALLQNINIPAIEKPKVVLQAYQNGKAYRKKADFVVLKSTDLSILYTNDKGALDLSLGDLLINEGKKAYIKELGKKKLDLYAVITDSLIDMQKNINIPNLQHINRTGAITPKTLFTDPAEKSYKVLDAVVIKSKKDFGFSRNGTTNECGDYICQNGILNCRNHPMPFGWPEKGRTYRDNNGTTILYSGCEVANYKYINEASLVNRPRTFYAMDTTLMQQKENPEYFNTLYWSPVVDITADKKISFYTSDQKGSYILIVQGIAENGLPFYGTQLIKVE